MSKVRIVARLPWENRWEQPSLEVLLESIKPHLRPPLDRLILELNELEGVRQTLLWYGPAWKWTLEYALHNEKGKEIDKLLYLVPSPELPLVSVPLNGELVEHLPVRRLNKYIRDGIRGAKCAVELNWAYWTPSAQTEIEHLMDLVKRKRKFLLEGGKPGITPSA